MADGDHFRLTTAADTIRWNELRWPERSEVSRYDQPLWDLIIPLLGTGAPAGTPSPVAAALAEEEPLDSTIHSSRSSYREAMLEHLLIGELIQPVELPGGDVRASADR